MLFVKSEIWSYLSKLNECSANCPTSCQYFCSKRAIVSLLWLFIDFAIERPFSEFQPWILSTLLQATTKGVLACRRIRNDSRVWGLHPSIKSITSMAISANEPPRVLNVEKEWWPGVSINSNPGESKFLPPINGEHSWLRISAGTSVAPMC